MTDGRLAVIGLGSVGALTLWQAALHAGVAASEVVGFEAHTPGHSRSAVGGDTRLFRMLYRGTPALYPILQRSLGVWGELEQETGAGVLARCGGLSIGTSGGRYLTELLATTAATGAQHTVFTRAEMSRRFPQHNLRGDDVAVYDPRAGALRTDRAVTAAVEAACARGARVHTGTAIDEIVDEQSGVSIRSGSQQWSFEKVIVAAGGWSRRLLPTRLHDRTHTRRIYLSWFTAREPGDFDPDVFPVFIRISGERSLYGAPSVDGATVKATLDGRSAPTADPDALARDLTDEEKAETLATVSEFLPGLVPSIVRSDAWPDLYTDDDNPMIGPLTPDSRIYLATGCCGAGFKIASGLGQIAAREALGGPATPGIDHLRPGRFLGALTP